MTEELSGTRLYVNTPLNQSNKMGIPLINLDWGSTNMPLKSVEEAVSERVWAIHGNPGSCGSYTGGISKNIIEGVASKILKHLNTRGEVFFGGSGASHWLAKIARHHRGGRLMLLQTEVHDALVRNWDHIDKHDNRQSDQLTWIRRMCSKYGPENLVLGISLSTHLTGGTFNDTGVTDYCKDLGVRVLIDATCYLAHHPRSPTLPSHFDYLVFSPHKFPGGPGSCGVMIAREPVSWAAEPGSQNVPGIVRIEESLKVFAGISEPPDVDGRIQRFASELEKTREGQYSIELLKWDDHVRSEPHFPFVVWWRSPDGHLLQVHPNLFAMMCTHVHGLQIRGGGMCAESFVSKGLCRISVPRYLFTEDLCEVILGKFRDLLRYMNYYVRCYEMGPRGEWRVRPEITIRTPEPNLTQVKSCCAGAQSPYFVTIKKEEILRGGMSVIDWMFPDIWAKITTEKFVDDGHFDDPERWYLHPNDLRTSDPEI